MKKNKENLHALLDIEEATRDIKDTQTYSEADFMTGFATGYIAAKLSAGQIRKTTARLFLSLVQETWKDKRRELREKREKEKKHECKCFDLKKQESGEA